MTIPKVINKSEFFEENEIMKGKAPYYFGNETIKLYHLIYLGMNVKYPFKFTSLLKQSFFSIFQLIYPLSKFVIFLITKIFFFDVKKIKMNKLVKIINIIFIIINLIFMLLNTFILIAKHYLIMNLISMNIWHNYSLTSANLKLIFLNIIPDFIIVIMNFIIICKNKDDNNLDNSLLIK